MDWTIPKRTLVSIKKGETGVPVWALQRLLNSLPWSKLVEDGDFGPATETAVRRYQSTRALRPDGVAGPQTQTRMAASVIKLADPDSVLPDGLAKSIVEGESANYIAAVNWNSPGGVDCGYTQRRVYDPHTDIGVRRAFDSKYQLVLLRSRLVDLSATYRTRPIIHTVERAWRLAVLSHNYPLASDRLSRTEETDLSSYWTTPQQWVVAIGAHFYDGHVVQSPIEWCRYYALGSPAHREIGRMTKYVRVWA